MTWQERLAAEHVELQERIDKLHMFMSTIQFLNLAKQDRDDLKEQVVHMRRYYAVLSARVARHCEVMQ